MSRVRGARAFRMLLRKLPDAVKAEMAEAMDQAGDEILAAQRAAVPVLTGRLRAGLSKKFYRSSLRLRVGFVGVIVNRRLPHENVTEFGQKAKTVTARRRKPSGGVSIYRMRLPRREKRPFVYSERAQQLRLTLGGRVRTIWQKALEKASQGISEE